MLITKIGQGCQDADQAKYFLKPILNMIKNKTFYLWTFPGPENFYRTNIVATMNEGFTECKTWIIFLIYSEQGV